MKYARITAETLPTATRVSSDLPTLPSKADTDKNALRLRIKPLEIEASMNFPPNLRACAVHFFTRVSKADMILRCRAASFI